MQATAGSATAPRSTSGRCPRPPVRGRRGADDLCRRRADADVRHLRRRARHISAADGSGAHATSAGNGAAQNRARLRSRSSHWAHGYSSARTSRPVRRRTSRAAAASWSPDLPAVERRRATASPSIADMTDQPGDLDFVMRQIAGGAAGDAIAYDQRHAARHGRTVGSGVTPRAHRCVSSRRGASGTVSRRAGAHLGVLLLRQGHVRRLAADADHQRRLGHAGAHPDGPERAFESAGPADRVALAARRQPPRLHRHQRHRICRNADAGIGCGAIGVGSSIAASGIGPLCRRCCRKASARRRSMRRPASARASRRFRRRWRPRASSDHAPQRSRTSTPRLRGDREGVAGSRASSRSRRATSAPRCGAEPTRAGATRDAASAAGLQSEGSGASGRHATPSHAAASSDTRGTAPDSARRGRGVGRTREAPPA